MDDFERDFMSQVRSDGQGQAPVAPDAVVPKGPIDKRWFVIGGLILLLIGGCVALAIISSSKQSGENFSLALNREKPYTEKVEGGWKCSSTLGPIGDESEAERPEDVDEIVLSGTELANISFMKDGTYVHEYANGDTEGGTYVQDASRLAMTKMSFSSGGDLKSGFIQKYGYDMFYTTDGKLALTEGATVLYVCE